MPGPAAAASRGSPRGRPDARSSPPAARSRLAPERPAGPPAGRRTTAAASPNEAPAAEGRRIPERSGHSGRGLEPATTARVPTPGLPERQPSGNGAGGSGTSCENAAKASRAPSGTPAAAVCSGASGCRRMRPRPGEAPARAGRRGSGCRASVGSPPSDASSSRPRACAGSSASSRWRWATALSVRPYLANTTASVRSSSRLAGPSDGSVSPAAGGGSGGRSPRLRGTPAGPGAADPISTSTNSTSSSPVPGAGGTTAPRAAGAAGPPPSSARRRANSRVGRRLDREPLVEGSRFGAPAGNEVGVGQGPSRTPTTISASSSCSNTLSARSSTLGVAGRARHQPLDQGGRPRDVAGLQEPVDQRQRPSLEIPDGAGPDHHVGEELGDVGALRGLVEEIFEQADGLVGLPGLDQGARRRTAATRSRPCSRRAPSWPAPAAWAWRPAPTSASMHGAARSACSGPRSRIRK